MLKTLVNFILCIFQHNVEWKSEIWSSISVTKMHRNALFWLDSHVSLGGLQKWSFIFHFHFLIPFFFLPKCKEKRIPWIPLTFLDQHFCGNQSVVDNLKYVHRRLGTCLKIKSELHIVATHNNPITKSRPIHLYLIFEKWSWKKQVPRSGFLVYFELAFYCLCSLQKSISKLIFAG